MRGRSLFVVLAVGLVLLSGRSSRPAEKTRRPPTKTGAEKRREPPAKPPPKKAPKPPPKKKPKGPVFQPRARGPLPGGVEEIIFAVRQAGGDPHWYANFGHWSSDPNKKMYGARGRLCRLNLRTGRLKVLINDPKGAVRDPQVHYDGRKVLFSWRRGGTDHFNLYEININGTGLRQITRGPWDDIEPTYLPDGDIMFCSSRCNRFVGCWHTPVAILYHCDADGGNIRPLSANPEHDNTPWPLPDGRILYTRWEYVDRSQVKFHHLWTMNPDGTNQMVYFGNMHPSTTMIDAKPIPGTDKVLASFAPGHGKREHMGIITIIDPNDGPDNRSLARSVSIGSKNWFRDPYPLTENAFLVAYRDKLALMNGKGELWRLYALPPEDVKAGALCHEPRPVRPRPRERVIPPRTDPDKSTGRLVLADVNFGRNMRGVKRGEIKKLLVLEVLPKPVNFNGGPVPLTIGGTFLLERILGTVPVEADGSAYMELPALRSLFFVALDANDMSVKRMHSFLTVMQGETTSCGGCHEPRTAAPPPVRTAALLATRRPPSRIEPIADVPDVFDFPRDIQPVLDRNCLKCHDYDKRSGGVILSGDRGPWYSHSYVTLLSRRQFVDGRNGLGNSAPRTVGSSASPLMKKISGGHHDVKATPLERKKVRLWIETGATYPGTYAALATGMVNVSANKAVLARRCAACHPGGKPRTDKHLLLNLTRPEKSIVLLAPLARKAGGLELCKLKKGVKARNARVPVFADTRDPDYRMLLGDVARAKRALDRIKRFDMPGFRPNVHYLREMKRYGILPSSSDPARAPDVYAMDRAYWKSLWCRPAAAGQ